MTTNRPQTRKKSNNDVIGGQWLPNLLTWGGVLLMITGGIIAYPTLQSYLVPPKVESLEFSVTAPPPPPTVVSLQSVTHATSTLVPTLAAPVILPETELVTPEPTPEAISTPTAPPAPTPTPDPASLVPNRILIPAIDLDAPVVEVGWETKEISGQQVSSWIVPNMFAAGWHKTSPPPGQIGNTVLNGHHNVHGEIFRDLVNLNPGDEIQVQTGLTTRYYHVTERHILEDKGQPVEMRMQNAQWILPTEDERLTIVTCWPYTNNTHRLIVVAHPIDPTPTPTPKGQ